MDTAKLQKLNIVLQRLYKMGAPKAGHHKLIGWVDNRFFKKKIKKPLLLSTAAVVQPLTFSNILDEFQLFHQRAFGISSVVKS